MCVMEAASQNIKNDDGQIFGGGHDFREIRELIKILEIEFLNDFAIHKTVEVGEITDHSGVFRYLSAHGYFEAVIVPVPELIVALSVDLAILFHRHVVILQTMRSRKHISPR